MEGADNYIIEEKPSRDNIDFITPPVTSFLYSMTNKTKTHRMSAFQEFSKRFCKKFYIPSDVAMCISLLFSQHGEINTQMKSLVDRIVYHHSSYVSKDKDSHYNIPPSFYFLHALNAINPFCPDLPMRIHPKTLTEMGARVSASALRYSLFELSDVYLSILIKTLNEEKAPPRLLLNAPPDLVPLTECHARVLAARIKRLGILPRDGTMSAAIYSLYFDIIKRCSDGPRPATFDPDMLSSGCVFELQRLVRQGKIIMKTEKKRKLSKKKEVPAGEVPVTKRRCVVGSHGRGIAIVKMDSSSLVPLEEYENSELAFLNKNETALAQLLDRLETCGYYSIIGTGTIPSTDGSGGGTKKGLVTFSEPLLPDQPCAFVFKQNIPYYGPYRPIGVLEKRKEGTKIHLTRTNRTTNEPLLECRAINFKSTLMPAIELSLGKDFPFEETVLSIVNRLSHIADAIRKGRRVQTDMIGEFSSVGYAVLFRTFVDLSTTKEPASTERELQVLKDLVDVVEVLSRGNTHFFGIMSWLLDPVAGYKFNYPKANIDSLFSYVVNKLCKYFAVKGREGIVYENNVFDAVWPHIYSSCVELYLRKRAFAADEINAAIDAMCYVKGGFEALIWIIRNAFPQNEDGKKLAFIRMIRNTVTQSVPSVGNPPLPSKSLEKLVEIFPDMCFMADKDFGVLRECIEQKSLAFHGILALPNVRATINCRYRYYGNAPAICLGHLMADTVRHDWFVCAFLKNGADPTVTTEEGENAMHFMARGPPLMDAGRPLDLIGKCVLAYNPREEWLKLRMDSEKTKRLFSARRHYDGATPIMVAVAHRNFGALENFKQHFPIDDFFNTAYGGSDCLRTIDVMVLSGMLFDNVFNRGNVTTAKPSIRLLAKAALKGKLYDNGDSPAPLNRVGLTFDENAYRGVRNIKQAICLNICVCKFASGRMVQGGSRQNKKVPSFEHKDNTWCSLNYANNAMVEQMYPEEYCITHWRSFKKDYVRLCAAIANNDRETLEKMVRVGEEKRGNLSYSSGKCTICLEVMNEMVEELNCIEECDHVYHKVCITEWEKNKRKCPTCNTVYEKSVPRNYEDFIGQG